MVFLMEHLKDILIFFYKITGFSDFLAFFWEIY